MRTFAPFVAGIGRMSYAKFLAYNVIGGVAWVVGFVYCGCFFGNLPVVKQHFSLVVLGIIVLSVMPAVLECIREYRRTEPEAPANDEPALTEPEPVLVVLDKESRK